MNLNEIATKKDIDNLKDWFLEILSQHIANTGVVSSNNKKYLNVIEASKLLGIAVSTLQSKMSRGEVPFCKPEGSRPYFVVDELEKYMSSNKRKSNTEIDADAKTYLLNKKIKNK